MNKECTGGHVTFVRESILGHCLWKVQPGQCTFIIMEARHALGVCLAAMETWVCVGLVMRSNGDTGCVLGGCFEALEIWDVCGVVAEQQWKHAVCAGWLLSSNGDMVCVLGGLRAAIGTWCACVRACVRGCVCVYVCV